MEKLFSEVIYGLSVGLGSQGHDPQSSDMAVERQVVRWDRDGL